MAAAERGRWAGLLLVVAMTGCAGSGGAQPLEQLPVGSQWRVEASEWPGLDATAAAKVSLEFAADGLAGDSGCNRFSASLTLSAGGSLALGPLLATKRACGDDQGNRIEQALFAGLRELQRAERAGPALRLLTAQGQALTLVAAEPAP